MDDETTNDDDVAQFDSTSVHPNIGSKEVHWKTPNCKTK